MKHIVLIVALAAALPFAAQVQSGSSGRLYVCHIDSGTHKALPSHLHHFRPITDGREKVLVPSEVLVLCGNFKSVIGFGKRLALGYRVLQAADDVNKARGADDCRISPGLRVRAVEESLREDGDHHVLQIELYVDQHGQCHLTARPKPRLATTTAQ